MNDGGIPDIPDSDNFGSYCALLAAFKIMKGRCQQLQTRLTAVEEENVYLRLQCGKDASMAITQIKGSDEKSVVDSLKEKVEELTKQKSQLTHHIFMVAAENRQLWSRLTKLTRTNKTLGNQLTKISDTLKHRSVSQKPENSRQDVSDRNIFTMDSGNNDQSLEEISLRLINSIMLEKSDLEQQYAQMVELQNNSDLNLQNIGFTYPEDSDSDSLEQLKQHNLRLSHTRDALQSQQIKLKKLMENLKNIEHEIPCKNCNRNAKKEMCQVGTQFVLEDSSREDGATQTSPSPLSLSLDKSNSSDNDEAAQKICPLCGKLYGKLIPFADFHEHVLSHFGNESVVENFELVH